MNDRIQHIASQRGVHRSLSKWSAAEAAILNKLFESSEWRTPNSKQHLILDKSFIKKVQQEILDRLHIYRTIEVIHYQMWYEIHRQSVRDARMVVVQYFGGDTHPKLKWRLALRTQKEYSRVEAWWKMLYKLSFNEPSVGDTPHRVHFREDHELTKLLQIPLSTLQKIYFPKEMQSKKCQLSCSFLELMGVECIESMEIVRFVSVISTIIKENPDISMEGMVNSFVARFPEARVLQETPQILRVFIHAFCRILSFRCDS